MRFVSLFLLAVIFAPALLCAEENKTHDPSGTWKWDSEVGGTTVNSVIRLNFDGKTLSGTYANQDVDVDIENGRIFVSRRTLAGTPVERLADDPLPEDAISRLYLGKEPGSHMRNFVECMRSREQPIERAVESPFGARERRAPGGLGDRLGFAVERRHDRVVDVLGELPAQA